MKYSLLLIYSLLHICNFRFDAWLYSSFRVFKSTPKSQQLKRIKPSSPRMNKSEISLNCERLHAARLLSLSDSK